MMKEKFKSTKGITLVALIITIIVLLILAVVSINSIRSNNILKYAKDAKEDYSKAEEKEKIILAVHEAVLVGKGDIDKNGVQSGMNSQFTSSGWEEVSSNADSITVKIKASGNQYKITLSNGTVELSVVKPQMTNLKIATDATGTTEAANNTSDGTTLYITFGASIEGGTISNVVDDEENEEMTANNGVYAKAVTENGKYTFTIKGTADGEERESKSIEVIVKKFENKIKVGAVVLLTSTSGTTEEFYIISYDESTQKAKALAKYNLKVGMIYNDNSYTDIEIDSTYGLQDSTMKGYVKSGPPCNGVLAFSSSRYWDDTYTPQGSSSCPWVYNNKSNLYQYVEAYKTKLGNIDKVSEVSLPSYEDIDALWLNKSQYTWLYSTSYWTGSAYNASSSSVNYVYSYGALNSNDSCDTSYSFRSSPSYNYRYVKNLKKLMTLDRSSF